MIAEDVQRKIWLIGLIGAVISGVIFLIWAIFLNRSAIIFHAKAPYTVNVAGFLNQSCAQETCTIVVAPGDYNITIQKQGYKTVTKSVTAPLGHPYEESLSLEFIPFIQETPQEIEDIFPETPKLTSAQLKKLGISSSIKLFWNDDKNLLCFIVRNPDNYRQTLYSATLDTSGNVSEPIAVTSFLRDLQSFIIRPADDGKKIAVIDQAQDQATIYIVDTEAQNRASLATYPMIRDMRWMPGTNDFIFQARPKNTAESLFLYNWLDGKTTQLELKTPLDDVTIMDSKRLIAVTNQKLPEMNDGQSLDGKLIPLGENQSTAEIMATMIAQGADKENLIITPTYSFVDYSLVSNQARLITTLKKDPFPEKILKSDDGKSVYFLQDDKVYMLSFED